MNKLLGIAALEQPEWPPYGKQRFYFEDMVNACKGMDIDFFFFSPFHIDSEKPILGWMYKDGCWQKTMQPLPYLIYDRAFSGIAEEKTQLAAFRNLLKAGPFRVLNPVDMAFLLDDKTAFHRFLALENIPTLEASPFEWLLTGADFDKNPVYYIKPISGSGGLGIYVAEKKGGQFLLKNHLNSEQETFADLSSLYHALAKRIEAAKYFVQPKANIIDYEGSPYDLRVLIQNYGEADYRISGMALRIGQNGSNVSNLQAGGSALPLEDIDTYFQSNFNRSLQEEKEKIEALCLHCCKILHQQYGSFLEIGLDLLLTSDRGPVVMEGNARPSRWIFNVLADRFKQDANKSAYFRGLRIETVRVPGLYALAID